MRVWLDPERIAMLGLTAEEVLAALRQQNVQVAGGSIGEPPIASTGAFQMSLQLQGRLKEAGEFEEIILKTGADGRVVRLKDVARVELGALNYTTFGYQDRFPATVLAVTQAPGSDALKTANAIKAAMAELSQAASPRASSIASSTTRPSSSRSRSGSCTRPSSRPWRWSCSSCCCSCRPGGRRSSRSSPSRCR